MGESPYPRLTPQSFGAGLRRMRTEREMSREGVYMHTGIYQNTLGRYESGHSYPGLINTILLAEVLTGGSVDRLIIEALRERGTP